MYLAILYSHSLHACYGIITRLYEVLSIFENCSIWHSMFTNIQYHIRHCMFTIKIEGRKYVVKDFYFISAVPKVIFNRQSQMATCTSNWSWVFPRMMSIKRHQLWVTDDANWYACHYLLIIVLLSGVGDTDRVTFFQEDVPHPQKWINGDAPCALVNYDTFCWCQ